MTGDDMIIGFVAKILRYGSDSPEHQELRRLFWIAGRCENCGTPHEGGDAPSKCGSCGNEIIDRGEVPPPRETETSPIVQWWDVVPPGYGAAFPILVVANRVALAWATCGLFSVFDRWDDARKALEAHKFVCTKAPP